MTPDEAFRRDLLHEQFGHATKEWKPGPEAKAAQAQRRREAEAAWLEARDKKRRSA